MDEAMHTELDKKAKEMSLKWRNNCAENIRTDFKKFLEELPKDLDPQEAQKAIELFFEYYTGGAVTLLGGSLMNTFLNAMYKKVEYEEETFSLFVDQCMDALILDLEKNMDAFEAATQGKPLNEVASMTEIPCNCADCVDEACDDDEYEDVLKGKMDVEFVNDAVDSIVMEVEKIVNKQKTQNKKVTKKVTKKITKKGSRK